MKKSNKMKNCKFERMRLLIHALAYKTKKGDVMQKSNKKIFLFFKRKILIFVVKFFKRRFLLFIVRKIIFIVRKISFFVLVVLVTSYRVSIIIPSMPSSADTFLLKSEIESISKKYEWESVSFIHQSDSLHYGRLVLSSVKRDRPLIINARVPLHETFSENEELFQPSSDNDEDFVEQNDLSEERPSWLVRQNLVFDLPRNNPLSSTDQREELFQPSSDNDEDFVEQNDLSEERPSWLVRQNLVFDLPRENPLYNTDQREVLLETPWWYMEERNDEEFEGWI